MFWYYFWNLVGFIVALVFWFLFWFYWAFYLWWLIDIALAIIVIRYFGVIGWFITPFVVIMFGIGGVKCLIFFSDLKESIEWKIFHVKLSWEERKYNRKRREEEKKYQKEKARREKAEEEQKRFYEKQRGNEEYDGNWSKTEYELACEFFGVSIDTPYNEKRQVYKALVRLYHPDLNKNKMAETKMKEVNNYWDIIEMVENNN